MAANTIQTLLVSLEARISQYEQQMRKSVSIANRSAKGIESRFATLNRSVASNFNALGGVIGKAFAGAAVLRGTQVLIDASTRIENSLKVAGLAGRELETVYDGLFKAAQANAAPLEALADLYGKAAQVQGDLGASTEELIGFTENVAVALRVSGKSAAESSGALLQLGQLLGAGTVRAEEFNSVQEGALPILQAVAAGLTEAGGSVATLRGLVIDGKVSSEAFFRAFEAGSGVLAEKVGAAEETISQRFIRLQNVLIDAAGRLNEVSNASGILGGILDALSNSVTAVGEAFDRAMNPGQALVEDLTSRVEAAAASIQTFADQSKGVFDADTEAAFQSLVTKVLESTVGFEEARAELVALGDADPKFDIVVGELSGLMRVLDMLRGSAVAAKEALSFSDVGAFPSQAAMAGFAAPIKPVTLASYPVTGTTAPGGGKGGESPAQKLDDSIEKQRERNRLLMEETALQSTLNPLIDDHGFALERLRVQQELQSAATAAGIKLTPELEATIDELATGYANATVEAKKLAEAQENAREAMQTWFDLGKTATRGFIDDLIEGKTAAEALGNVFNKLGSQLIDMGLGALFGKGGGDFGAIGKLFGFAGGGYTGDGGKHEPAGVVHKGEYVFTKAQTAKLGAGNLSMLAKGYANGGMVGSPGPVISRAANDNGPSVPISISIDATGADAAGLARVERRLAQMQAELPGKIKQVVGRRSKDIW